MQKLAAIDQLCLLAGLQIDQCWIGLMHVQLAIKHRLPAIFWNRSQVAEGRLISLGPNSPDMHRRSAGYVTRILKGEKPADLPVQEPTTVELIINAKTAKEIGVVVPPALLARADEVIE